MKVSVLTIALLILWPMAGFSQDSLVFKGQLSGFVHYGPDNRTNYLAGFRYLPEVNYALKFQNALMLDFDAAANVYGSLQFQPGDTGFSDGGLKPYRLWARFSGKQFEVRAGLQKINFGSSTLLRPLQWFDDIDPTDPLQFSNGVYGLLGRYYFLNNANIWLWFLYGNENPRGFELIANNTAIPEFGGRLQLPVPHGEVAFSYHHRTADSRNFPDIQPFERVPENKYALDGKWDVGAGLWFEASWVQKRRNLGLLTHQVMASAGADYTLGIGNGLNIGFEHLVFSGDSIPFAMDHTLQVSAAMLSYPVGLFDKLSGYTFILWDSGTEPSVLLQYEHSFRWLSAYLMAYYTPEMQQNLFSNRYNQVLTGPGIRVMIIINH